MKPIKISSRITLVEADGQARVETKADLHPAEVFSAVEDWIVNNQKHPRRGDVESWLDLYEQQTPRPPRAKRLSEEMLQKIKWSRKDNQVLPVASQHVGEYCEKDHRSGGARSVLMMSTTSVCSIDIEPRTAVPESGAETDTPPPHTPPDPAPWSHVSSRQPATGAHRMS
jgi:hypothetical protein